ncbi:hypothetical protein [Budvicia aquatica]|uniref:Uncharacterized protein n=2 Tax=Budvicia aquatica TaxID=82979 RepID=A0A2C6DM37_9GAMM|nr:hypothetical protein [Budvicia aquatica]PHI29753.1 hypothetical protein CRN84_10585 [Budvicia aquatica]
MRTYLSVIQKQIEVEKAAQVDREYKPHTLHLKEQIQQWVNTLSTASRQQELYETDLCRTFKCHKEDLAIAMDAIGISGKKINRCGVLVRAYFIEPKPTSYSELSDGQRFLLKLLTQGSIGNNQDGWPESIPSRTLYEMFIDSPEHEAGSDRSFGRDVLSSGIAVKRRSAGSVNVWRYDLLSLNEARQVFTTQVLCNMGYNWE